MLNMNQPETILEKKAQQQNNCKQQDSNLQNNQFT
jgi:hypothetical protein